VISGDGVLSIHDTRKLDKKVATCVLDDELLTLTTIKVSAEYQKEGLIAVTP
jgi:hypothetical protein